MKAVGTIGWSQVGRLALWLVAGLMFGGGEVDAQVPGIEHVVIIGVDGLSPDGIRKAETPILQRIDEGGSEHVACPRRDADGEQPELGLDDHGGRPGAARRHLERLGAGQVRHRRRPWAPAGSFPTIFGLLRSGAPARIACFHDWDGFGRLFERAPPTSSRTRRARCDDRAGRRYIKEKKPAVHLHPPRPCRSRRPQAGHGTPEYYRPSPRPTA